MSVTARVAAAPRVSVAQRRTLLLAPAGQPSASIG